MLALIIVWSVFLFSNSLFCQEIFIYRPGLQNSQSDPLKTITVHGEYFGYLLFHSKFPSYNDLKGPNDRWNFGFQNIVFLGKNTRFFAQLVTHDDGSRRTKFDWHFSLRQQMAENLVIMLGHDSNHDSDYQSQVFQKKYFLNRNYFGFGLPFTAGDFYFEPFTWFFHHTNQRGHLDYSGDKLFQEYGIRIGTTWMQESFRISFQAIAQSESFFSLGQAYLADLIVRTKLFPFFELSAGVRLWKDMQESQLGNKNQYYAIHGGIVITF